MNKVQIFDILLYPKKLYGRITGRKMILLPGILLIGIIDLAFPFDKSFFIYFSGKQYSILINNIILSLVFIIILGFTDVLFFSLPLADLFKYFSKKIIVKEKTSINTSGLLIKTMKIYIMIHFIVIPVNLLVYYSGNIINLNNYAVFAYIVVLYFYIIMPVWFSGAITRGIMTVYGFNPLFKWMVFLVIFLWNFLLGFAFDYILSKWMTVFLR
jgi:hypothetical protein